MAKTPVRLALVVALSVVAVAAVFVASAIATDRPGFCPTCHEMRPYRDAWSTGPHRRVWCIDCHVEPGMAARLAHKFVALQEVYSHFTADNSFPRPQPPRVPDARCNACHQDLPAVTAGSFPHALHAERGECAQCHYDTGHSVRDQALQAAGVLNASVAVQRLSGKTATVGAGKANLAGHTAVSCSRCHDMQATPCSSCHAPRGKKHPKVAKMSCADCHSPSGPAWAFAHPGRVGEHSYRSFACNKCHPSSWTQVYCTCHKGRPPRD